MQDSEYEVRDALYLPTYEYNYKVITECDTILQEHHIINGTNVRIQRDIQV